MGAERGERKKFRPEERRAACKLNQFTRNRLKVLSTRQGATSASLKLLRKKFFLLLGHDTGSKQPYGGVWRSRAFVYLSLICICI